MSWMKIRFLEQNNEEENVSIEKFSKDAVQDYESWEERAYDDIPNYKLEYENYFHNDSIPIFP